MKKVQFKPSMGPMKSATGGNDAGSTRQDTAQMSQMGMRKASQTRGSGITASPTIKDRMGGNANYQSSRIDVSTGTGASPKKSSHPIMTSAPTDARTLNRAPAGWLK